MNTTETAILRFLKSTQATLIVALVLLGITIYQISRLTYLVSNEHYDLGVQDGRRQATMEIMTSVVPVGEAPDTVKDEAGNEFLTDGFTYVIIKPKR